MQELNELFFSVSKLSHFEYCPKRCKLEVFKQVGEPKFGVGAIIQGNRMHYLYSYPNKGFDRIRLRLKLNAVSDKGRFRKNVPGTNIVVIGAYDDLRIIRDLINNKKFAALVEVKTTSKKYMWSREVKAAIRQLQLYMWLLKEYLEYFGYPLWKRSYVEIYSQKTGYLIRSIPVEYDSNIEEWIKYVVDCFKGIHPVQVPPFKFCKFCPVNVKSSCDWYQVRKEYYAKKVQAI